MLALALTAAAIASAADEPCQCEDTWQDATGSCQLEPQTLNGCPTLEELRRCDPTARERWCRTRTPTCADQYGSQRGSGKMSMCDMTSSAERRVIKGIAEHNKCMSMRNNNGTIELFDLTPLQKTPRSGDESFRELNWEASKRSMVGSDDQDYFINVCGGLVGFDGNQGTTNPAGPVAAYEENPSNTSERTHVLARFGPSTNLTVVKDNDLRLSMDGGDPSDHGDAECQERKVDIIFFCQATPCGDTTSTGLGQPVFVDEFKKCEYVFVWNSCAACPIGSPERIACLGGAPPVNHGAFGTISTMAPSAVLLITVAVLFSVYIVVGFAYNRFVHGERGLNQIPHYEFWSSCFSNVSAAPGAIAGLFIGKPKPSSVSQNFHSGLLDDDDDEDDLEDADDSSFS